MTTTALKTFRQIYTAVILLTLAVTASCKASAREAVDSIAVCEPEEPLTATDAGSATDSPTRVLTVEETAVATDSIRAGYDSDWQRLSMQGRLIFDALPIRPNVKIYMERGKSVIMSARAPIMGEVARIEINRDSVTMINKYNRTYCSYDAGGILGKSTDFMADVQDILLGQVAFPGRGRISHDLASRSQWIEIPGQGTLIYPGADLQLPGADYGYVMDPDGWQLRSFALLIAGAQTLLETTYLYGDEGWTLGLRATVKDRPMEGEMQLSYPDYSPTPLGFTDAGKKYRKTDLKGLLKF